MKRIQTVLSGAVLSLLLTTAGVGGTTSGGDPTILPFQPIGIIDIDHSIRTLLPYDKDILYGGGSHGLIAVLVDDKSSPQLLSKYEFQPWKIRLEKVIQDPTYRTIPKKLYLAEWTDGFSALEISSKGPGYLELLATERSIPHISFDIDSDGEGGIYVADGWHGMRKYELVPVEPPYAYKPLTKYTFKEVTTFLPSYKYKHDDKLLEGFRCVETLEGTIYGADKHFIYAFTKDLKPLYTIPFQMDEGPLHIKVIPIDEYEKDLHYHVKIIGIKNDELYIFKVGSYETPINSSSSSFPSLSISIPSLSSLSISSMALPEERGTIVQYTFKLVGKMRLKDEAIDIAYKPGGKLFVIEKHSIETVDVSGDKPQLLSVSLLGSIFGSAIAVDRHYIYVGGYTRTSTNYDRKIFILEDTTPSPSNYGSLSTISGEGSLSSEESSSSEASEEMTSASTLSSSSMSSEASVSSSVISSVADFPVIPNTDPIIAVENEIIGAESVPIKGYYKKHDFNGNGKIEYNDWAYKAVPSGRVYQLLGKPPTSENIFGWKEVNVSVEPPYDWYFLKYGEG
ncbi:MAG: hypothetical protein GXO19_07910, partial [Epsilonproteobacteria bacterium]|nr:hypothetical protein [Campylobacterota bacterium]NPA57636.1 hypothetical protein [Campylobacterota bacterium]